MPDPSDTWAPAPATRRAPQRTAREPTAAPVPADGALRVAPLALAALVASAVILAAVLVTIGFAMGRATRVAPAAVTCRCAP